MNMNKNLEYSKNKSSRKYDQFATKNQSKNSNGKQRSFDSDAEETGRVEICKSKSEDRSQKETGRKIGGDQSKKTKQHDCKQSSSGQPRYDNKITVSSNKVMLPYCNMPIFLLK